MEVRVRPAGPADLATVAGFNTAMALETEQCRLEPDTVAAGVRAVLEDPTHGRYFLAEDASGTVVGQLMVTYEWSDWRNGRFWWIQSVYVRPETRRQGVFSALFRHLEALLASEPRVCGLRLYVECDNELAQRAYASLGLEETGYIVMEIDRSGAVTRPGEAPDA